MSMLANKLDGQDVFTLSHSKEFCHAARQLAAGGQLSAPVTETRKQQQPISSFQGPRTGAGRGSNARPVAPEHGPHLIKIHMDLVLSLRPNYSRYLYPSRRCFYFTSNDFNASMSEIHLLNTIFANTVPVARPLVENYYSSP